VVYRRPHQHRKSVLGSFCAPGVPDPGPLWRRWYLCRVIQGHMAPGCSRHANMAGTTHRDRGPRTRGSHPRGVTLLQATCLTPPPPQVAHKLCGFPLVQKHNIPVFKEQSFLRTRRNKRSIEFCVPQSGLWQKPVTKFDSASQPIIHQACQACRLRPPEERRCEHIVTAEWLGKSDNHQRGGEAMTDCMSGEPRNP